MALFHVLFLGWTGRPRTFIRHTLSAGKTWQVVPGTGAAVTGAGGRRPATSAAVTNAPIPERFILMAIGSGAGYG